MALRHSVNDRNWAAFGEHNTASVDATPIFRFVGGLVKTNAESFSDGDGAALSLDTSGRLRCILEGASFVVSGSDLEIDVSAFRGTTGVTDRQDAWVYTHDEDLSTVSEKWQGFGGYDETADLFRAFPISTDDAAMPVSPQFVAVGGEYRASATTYADGDATILQTDVNGNLLVNVAAGTYVDDSTDFTVATSEGTAIMALNTSDVVDANDIGILRMTAQRDLAIGVFDASGNRMPTGDALARSIFAAIGDGTTTAVVETTGTKKALNVNITDGTNDMPTMDAVARSGYVIDNDGTNTPVAFFDLDSGAGTEFVKGIGIRTAASGGSVEGVRITDGTNYMNTMDAVGRAGYQYITDGTNTMPTMDVVGRAGYVYITDGTNTQPTLDVNTRAGFFQLTDGTDEIDIATDNATAKTTGFQVMGAYNATLPTYTTGDSAILQTDDRGRLISTIELNDYTDDSNEFTVASSKLIAIGGIATTDTVQAGDVGAFKMTTSRELAVSAVQSGVWDIGTVTTLTGITNDVSIDDGGNSITVDGTVAATQSGTWNIGTVTTLTTITNDVNIADGGNSITVDDGGTTLSIDDGGGSITIDGTVTSSTNTEYTEGDIDVSITGIAMMWEDAANTLRAVSAAKPLPVDITDSTIAVTQSGTWNITTLTGITNDVNIADGGNVISIDDAGGSLTVDGTVAATQSGVWNIGTVTTLTGITNDVSIDDGGNSITVDDGGSSLTVDVGAALPAGTNLIGNVKISDGTETVNVNASNQLEIDITGASSQSSASISAGKEVVAAAGTAEQLNGGVSKAVADGFKIAVKALVANTGLVYVGGAAVAAANGFQLSPGESVSLAMNDVNKIYIDVAVNGEGATWIVEA